jgi:hypothetical protein
VTPEEVRRSEACRAIRVVERYLYWALGNADEGSKEARQAQDEMRLAVGLRRKLDSRLERLGDDRHPSD